MRKFLFILSMAICGVSFKTYADLNIIGGPAVRIPGITAATIIQLTGYNPNYAVRWLLNGAVVGGGSTFYATAAGSYFAQVNFSTNPNNPFWTSMGSIEVQALAHNITVTGPNPLNQTALTQLCLNSNGAAYASSNTWIRNGITDNTQSCKIVDAPGVFAVSVTYVYGSQTSVVTTSSVTISPSLQAPVLQLSKTTYDPVTPPSLSVTNASAFTAFWIVCNGQAIAYQTSPAFVIPNPGRYTVAGVLGGKAVFTNDFIITKGTIPVPYIISDGGVILTYDDPDVQLLTQSGYNAGYTWYFNNQVITGASNTSVTIVKPGTYTVQACAMFPDGISECKTSSSMQITGEALYVNDVRKKVPRVENIETSAQLNSLPTTQVNVSTVYADGFARPIQHVQRALSPQGKDIAVMVKYDAFGRETKKFLPMARQTNDGLYYFIPNSLGPLYNFYQQNNDKIANTAYPFSETLYESSPLSRPLKQGAPGEDWQLSTGHVTSFSYASNLATDKVWIWGSSAQGITASSFYLPGNLFITEIKDEDGKVVREFKDNLNHTVLTEKLIEGGIKLRTYYVYDDFGRLAYIVPAKTSGALPNTATVTITTDVLSRECFSYQFDERGRIIKKNIPGAGLMYFVYDPWDRVVLTQQANQRIKNKWSFNKYDALNRLVMTGEVVLISNYAATVQAVTSFYLPAATIPSIRYEELNGSFHGYTNRSFPVLANANQAYSIMYYDDYSFLPLFGASGYQFVPEPTLGLAGYFTRNQKLITGTKTVILGTTNYLKSVNYYDEKHQLVQLISDNHLGGIDRMSNAFDFIGQLVKERMVHQGLQTISINKEIVYDHAGRILKMYHTINNGSPILLADNHYNELSMLIEKNIHSTDGTTFLQSLDYAYNIRGWLSQMNPSESETNTSYADLYSFELSYTTPTQSGITDFQPAFNGNISAFTESRPSRVDDTNLPFKSTYSYRYDARNQLNKATYYQLSNHTKDGTYDVPVITYDENGNILSLKRKGITNGAPGLIDDLIYSYNGNQLIQVNDLADQLKGFVNR